MGNRDPNVIEFFAWTFIENAYSNDGANVYGRHVYDMNKIMSCVYIASGCAAWMVSQFDDLNDIDLFFVRTPVSRKLKNYIQTRARVRPIGKR